MVRVMIAVAAVALVAVAAIPPLLKEKLRGELWTVVTLLVISAALGLMLALRPDVPPLARGLIAVLQPVGEWLLGPESP